MKGAHTINLKVSGLVVSISKYKAEYLAGIYAPKKHYWHGISSKFYRFHDFDAIRAHIKNAMDKEQAKADARLLKQATAKSARSNIIDTYQIGDILNSSWGYDQTNVELVQIVRKTAKTLIVRAIAGTLEGGTGNSMAGYLTPIKDKFIGPEVPVTIQPYDNGNDHCLIGCFAEFHNTRDGERLYKRNGVHFYKTTAEKKHYVSWYA